MTAVVRTKSGPIVAGVLAALVAAIVVSTLLPARPAGASTVPTTPPATSVDGTGRTTGASSETLAPPVGYDPSVVASNDLLTRDDSECVGTLQRPDCGSSGRGGWRMALLFGVVVAALGFVAWNIRRGMRRAPAASDASTDGQ